MTITPDETPRLANRAERRVYQALLEQLQPNDRVIPGQRVTDHLKDHEVDFVVAIEGAGIVCLEVKGGEVWHDGDDVVAEARRPRAQDRTGPPGPRSLLRAARLHREGRPLDPGPAALGPRRRPAQRRDRPTTSRCRSARAGRSSTATTSRRSSTSSRTSSSARNSTARCSPSEGIDQLSTALSGRGLPQRSVVARALANEDAADALTEHQAVILDAIQSAQPRRGPRGSGQRQDLPGHGAGPPTVARRANASRWSATPTAWPPTWSASPPPGRGANNRPTSASSTTSASCGAHPKVPTNRRAPTRPSSSGNTTFRSK